MWRREVDGTIISGSCGFVMPTTIAQSRYFWWAVSEMVWNSCSHFCMQYGICVGFQEWT
jgi:hypothetical protein